MKHPKKADQAELMGLRCSFDAEYCRDYLKKKIGVEKEGFGGGPGRTETVPVRWKKQKHKIQSGWIVGFGFCFNGTIEREGEGNLSFKYFRASKRVDYVRVRTSTTGKEIKVPASNIINW